MPLTYATEADVEAQTPTDEDVPANVARRLVVASRWVRHATRTAVYDTDPTGLPTDETLLEALRDATVEQVLCWHRTGIDPDEGSTGAASGVVASKSLRSATIQYAVYAESAKDRARVATTLCAEARLVLADAGLLGGPVTVYG
ncbi:hypothetical protein [Ornithinimicrobium cerasi]|uniref:hypothetical protein n=1 Tax=Ornithinimicrobium cerasi TaxID=2248773 RepID=UPI000F010711|nr:hypothetical protein [Ornithinimicrobium cerasi]